MATAKYFGVDNIVKAFQERSEKPYWALWQGKEIHDQYTGEDLDESLEQLRNELINIRNSDNSAILVLHPHSVKLPKSKIKYPYKDDGYPVVYPIYCTVFAKSQLHNVGSIGGMQGYYPAVPPVDTALAERLSAMESTLNAMSMPENDYEDEDDEIGKISRILENDTVKTLIGAFVGYLTKGTSDVPTNITRVTSLGAVSKDWEDTVNVLFSKGVTLEHLQKLAAMPEKKIQMLLTML
jgi:hypothetical protein